MLVAKKMMQSFLLQKRHYLKEQARERETALASPGNSGTVSP